MSEIGAPSQAPLSAIDQDIFCQHCGYNLRGLTGTICPECGESLDLVRAAASQIPWPRRREIGTLRAYGRTVWLVMFRQQRFAQEMARPVDYRQAQLFRWLTVMLAAAAIVIGGAVIIMLHEGQVRSTPTVPVPEPPPLFYVLMAGGVLLFLAGMTGIPSYFFHPTGLSTFAQNRAIALSYYACGPLALMAVPVGCAVISVLFFRGSDTYRGLFSLLAVLLPGGLVAAWWLDLSHLSRRLLPQRRGQAWKVAVGVPLLWLVLAVLCLGVFPLSVLLVVIALSSLMGG